MFFLHTQHGSSVEESLAYLKAGGVESSLQLYILPRPIFKSLSSALNFQGPFPLPRLIFIQQPQYYRDYDIASPFPFFHVLFSSTAMILLSSSSKLDILPQQT